MSALSLSLPESLHRAAKELAVREGISVNQLVATALAEKLAALMTAEYLERAHRGSRERFLTAMERVPDAEPESRDRLPRRVKEHRTPATATAGSKTRPAKRLKK